MEIKKPRIKDPRIRKILHAIGEEKTYDDIEDEAPCRRSSISDVKKWYNSLQWEEAVVFAEHDEKILKARIDYLEKKAQEALKIDNRQKDHLDKPVGPLGLAFSRELERHWDELEMFGKRLRGDLYLQDPIGASVNPTDRPLIWPISEEEFYPSFRQHLTDNPCWGILVQAESDYYKYQQLCKNVHAKLIKQALIKLQGLPQPFQISIESQKTIIDSIFEDIFDYVLKGKATNISLEFYGITGIDYSSWIQGHSIIIKEPVKEITLLKIFIAARLGWYKKRSVLNSIKSLLDTYSNVSQTQKEFRKLLASNSKLRKQIINGHCEMCP